MKAKKHIRIAAIIMLFAIFHYVAGYRLMYSLGILYAKDEAKECMVEKNSNIQKITLSSADYNSLKWTEKNKEFTLHNQMYDVRKIQKCGDNYIITVYSDTLETGWLASLHSYEKELFQPDKSAKGTKSAEDVMSSFQKNCTPSSEFKIHIFASSGLIQPVYVVEQHHLQLPDNIWHPPTNC